MMTRKEVRPHCQIFSDMTPVDSQMQVWKCNQHYGAYTMNYVNIHIYISIYFSKMVIKLYIHLPLQIMPPR